MRTLLLLAALMSGLACNGEASAHAFLLKSVPVVGAAGAAPKTIRLEFSEAVELGFSGVDVKYASGAAISASRAHYDGGDKKVLLVDMPQLAPGSYQVKWHVVSVDTHRTEGDFSFTVKP